MSLSKVSAWSSALGKPSTRNRSLLLLIMAFLNRAMVTCRATSALKPQALTEWAAQRHVR
jgi:hypothetical protein